MKNIFYCLIMLILLLSCSDKERELELSNKITKLQTELNFNRKLITSLKEINTNSKNEVKQTKEEFTRHTFKTQREYVSKEYAAFFLKDELKHAIDKEKTIVNFIDDFSLYKWDIVRGIANSYVLVKRNDGEFEDIDFLSKQGICRYVISKIDRSPESLEKILTPSTKEFIFSILKKDNIYKKSGTSYIVEALLNAHEELNDRDLNNIYQIITHENKGDDDIEKYYSKKNRALLDNENYTEYETWTDLDQKLFLVYSFWARRYKEGNKTYTYNFLLETHNNLTGETLF